MRILTVHNEYGAPSGEEAVIARIRRLLESRGHTVVAFIRTSRDIPRMRLGKVRAFFSGIYSVASRRAMERVLRGVRPDVVHVHNVFPLISPSVLGACREAGVPVVMTVHNYRLICPTGLFMVGGRVCTRCAGAREHWCVLRNCERSLAKSLGYALRNVVARKARLFLDNVAVYAALTEFQRRVLVAEGFPAERIEVVPNMAAPEGIEPTPGEGAYVGYAGRMSPEKGIAVLLAAARQLDGVPLRLAGDASRMPGLADEVPQNVSLAGFLGAAQLRRFYRGCKMVVLASTCFEGFPAMVAEAMLHGKPVVCPRIGGLSEIVDDGRTGLLFEPGDGADLAATVRHLWDRPDLCRRMGRAGRRKAEQEYSPSRYYVRLMGVYRKALALGPGACKAAAGTAREAPVAPAEGSAL